MKIFKVTALLMSIIVMLMISPSCKKEYIDKINILAADTLSGITRITSFNIKEFSTDTILKATIKGDSIIVYWPAYKRMPKTIRPEIQLATKAVIFPASGDEVAFKTGTTFEVTSESSIKKSYRLYIDFRQQQPFFEYINDYLESGRFDNQINGQNFLTDTSQTKVSLIGMNDDKEYATEISTLSSTFIRFYIPRTVPANQLYEIKVVNGIYTLSNSYEPNRYKTQLLEYLRPSLYNESLNQSIKIGETFLIRGNMLVGALKAVFLVDNNGSYMEIPVEIAEFVGEDNIRIKIPSAVPIGTYTKFALYYTSEGLNGKYAYTSLFSLKITE